jgi:3-dehydroquinate dehydratase II
MSAITNNRIEVMHGVNLDQLGRRDPDHYGRLDLAALERQVDVWARELGLSVRFFQTNHEGDFVEHLHALGDLADGVILNPGAWTHYAWSIHDALELTHVPAIEVHLSAVNEREQWRQLSVVRDLCVATVSGKGPDGYREALELMKKELVG